jgi:hypothetical protein
MTFEEMIASPGTYSYCGFSIINKGKGRIDIIDESFGRVIVEDEIISTKSELDRLINITRTSRGRSKRD